MKLKLLTRTEEFCLISARLNQDDAYGAAVQTHLIDFTEVDWSLSVVYHTLDRLTRKGLLTAHSGKPTPERGGRSKRYYKLTVAGLQALALIRAIQEDFWGDMKERNLLPPPLHSHLPVYVLPDSRAGDAISGDVIPRCSISGDVIPRCSICGGEISLCMICGGEISGDEISGKAMTSGS